MSSQPERWTQQERRQALKAFFDSEDGRRFIEVFSLDSVSAQDRQLFRRDAERRARFDDEEAGRWWNSLQALVQNEAQRHLALAEPLAQNGLSIEELYELLPDGFDPQALMQAIERASGSPGAVSPGISNVAGWMDEQLRERLAVVKAQLDWEKTESKAREWWEAFEQEQAEKPALVLRLAEELAIRKATVAEFHDAYLHSNTDNIQAILHYLDYLRLRQAEAAKPADADAALTSDDSGWWLKPAPNVTKVRGWAEDRIRRRLDEVKAKLDWENTAEEARAWWESFEQQNQHRLALVLRLAEELVNRKATIAGFHTSFGHSAVKDIRANLLYLDYTRLKAEKEEERKKAEKEESKRRQEEREKKRQERVTKARTLFPDLLPFLEADQPFRELPADAVAILLNVPREDVPDSVRERFDRAIGAFDYETVVLDETGKVTERRPYNARRLVEELIPGVALELVEVPGGTFQMGTADEDVERVIEEYARYGNKREDAERWVNQERPRHPVTVSPFYIGKFTITQEQWSIVAAWEKVERDLNADPSNFKGDDRPVECVSWEDVKEFCARLSRKTGREYRLPTEAEWEYACRAGTTTPFAFGETITPEIVNYNGEYPYAKAKKGKNRGETVPVGSLGVPNAFGLFDMHGNVWEWCEDVYHNNYEGAPSDGSAWLSGGDSSFRRLRGGSWGVQSIYCRSAYRYDGSPGDRIYGIGVRVVVARAF
ncbi:MAG: formylglycine-generating enzyme family protein [Blastocatellia bacterium]